MNIVLIGYRCCGKSAVGKLLAEKLGRDFVDSDTLIQLQSGRPIPQIVAENGWAAFRDLERQVISELARKDNLVIATGGGVVLDGRNVSRLKENGWVVWLQAGPATIGGRMAADIVTGQVRPSLTGADPVAEIAAVLLEREPHYNHAGDIAIDTGSLGLQEVVDWIIDRLPPDFGDQSSLRH
ncbi:MAG: shikimate kinase [Deltaproteobacteria bacterium]|nr:shikimate kinase [Deltaproteobacteria bacterium]